MINNDDVDGDDKYNDIDGDDDLWDDDNDKDKDDDDGGGGGRHKCADEHWELEYDHSVMLTVKRMLINYKMMMMIMIEYDDDGDCFDDDTDDNEENNDCDNHQDKFQKSILRVLTATYSLQFFINLSDAS